MTETARILAAGDRAVSVQFGDVIDPAVYARVNALNARLKQEKPAGLVETIPTFRSLMVQYDPLVLGYDRLEELLWGMIREMSEVAPPPKKVFTVPVCFGGSHGPDLADVAAYHGVEEEEIVRLFCSSEFLIYMLGFTPGYPYIGGVPAGLVTPRLDSPRVKVPTGAVGIGGEQLGIYPIESPGGFRLVGNTPVKLYDPAKTENPVLLEAGAYIRFEAIGEEEYENIRRRVEEGSYVCRIEEG